MTSNCWVRSMMWSNMGWVLWRVAANNAMGLSWLCAGEPFDVLVPGAAIIDGSAAGEADKIADAARVGDQAAELADSISIQRTRWSLPRLQKSACRAALGRSRSDRGFG